MSSEVRAEVRRSTGLAHSIRSELFYSDKLWRRHIFQAHGKRQRILHERKTHLAPWEATSRYSWLRGSKYWIVSNGLGEYQFFQESRYMKGTAQNENKCLSTQSISTFIAVRRVSGGGSLPWVISCIKWYMLYLYIWCRYAGGFWKVYVQGHSAELIDAMLAIARSLERDAKKKIELDRQYNLRNRLGKCMDYWKGAGEDALDSWIKKMKK